MLPESAGMFEVTEVVTYIRQQLLPDSAETTELFKSTKLASMSESKRLAAASQAAKQQIAARIG